MKVVILAGGYGTRLSEHTDRIPKPMVTIGGLPIIWHIMNHYASYGFNDFYLALGYKSEVIKEYFLNYSALNSDFSIDLSSGKTHFYNSKKVNWTVTLVDTGLDTMTGGRVKKLQNFIGDEQFMLTYGDGISDINLNSLLKFHNSHGKMVTLSAVRPGARFGVLEFDGERIKSFEEKPRLHEGWINGGFFVCDAKIFRMINSDLEMLEREPFDRIVELGEMMAYKHHGFWQCMDTKRDHDLLESIWSKGCAWKV